MSAPFALFVFGPTATGKSDLALSWAERLSADIVNCDSVQCYQYLDIGSAKPAVSERQTCPHHLYDICQPPSVMTAGEYRKKAMDLVHSSDRPLIFVGGTGFYFKALENGMFEPAADDDVKKRLENRLETEGLETLFAELERKDSVHAQKVGPNDQYRILRALEIIEVSGESVTAIHGRFEKKPFPVPLLKIGIDRDREELRLRVRQRTEKMLSAGWVAEVEGLRAKGLSDWAPMSSVGYREIASFLDGQLEETELIGKIVTSTMQLAKRQRTWFKKETELALLSNTESLDQRKHLESLTAEFVERILRL